MTRVISKALVEQIYTPEEAIKGCFKAFSIISHQKFTAPVRTTLKTDQQDLLLMPCAVHEEKMTDLAVKILSVVPGNRARGLPLIPGKCLVYDNETGNLDAIMDGFMVTFKRTGAVAGATAQLLHPAPAPNVVIFGCGAQGYAGLESILTAHPEVKQVTCFDFYKPAAESYVKKQSETDKTRTYILGEDVEKAVREADIIHCATTSKEALFKGEWVKEGAHISAIGAYKLDMRELPNELLARPNVRVFIDQFEAMREEAGDIMDAINNGFIKEEQLMEFGTVINGDNEGRQNEKQITIAKMVGVAAQDTVASQIIYEIAKEKNLGVVVEI
ncbi:Ornithine cyclodeaminase/mu-crystallin family protein [Trichomonas vaginalis G3]|uniref:Ornithine cyclodeaminase/mu-crystallin family protein n=1 Tax=Trichomonas vaginalis (strain ATCC PRA-98 / G3) TaxID=412133 RepID=A2EIT3_TRIV3|nr:thiomorpholine-carboxylate dehydrogenase protein [Trichomonas vaginalis G3]EAY07417.1 Ornithine cyclodeaminase/mu-crystallin family protein [Trichomonas vaginalis G3]KAI5484627.1 thiomorpholine-carboxylate dehydrogenase protein [Trichomonas vaginalis G3]|eukprot:XP_001319640.1 Ornithine cyclodeaminase/mu-crystallin family protein [Trichomonas vaginalis G3]